MTGLSLSLQLALISLASAHPGPIGHTHDGDEWPFGVVAVLTVVALGLLTGTARLAFRKKE